MSAATPCTRLRGDHAASSQAAVDLYWIPLGAGGHSVRFNGRVFEAIAAARQHRRRCDLYHVALVVELEAPGWDAGLEVARRSGASNADPWKPPLARRLPDWRVPWAADSFLPWTWV